MAQTKNLAGESPGFDIHNLHQFLNHPNAPWAAKTWNAYLNWMPKFLVATALGVGLGVMGMTTGITPLSDFQDAMQFSPGMAFLNAIKFTAPFYIALNAFKSFSQQPIQSAAKPLLMFTGIMLLGVGMAMAGSEVITQFMQPITDVGGGGELIESKMDFWSIPAQYLLHSIVGGAVLGAVYNHVAREGKELSSKFKKAVKRGGDSLLHAADTAEYWFGGFIEAAAPPAIVFLIANSLSGVEPGALFQFAPFYVGMAGLIGASMGTLALAGRLAGYKPDQLKAMTKPMIKAFGTSSSATTIPTTKGVAQDLRIPERTRELVVPLGATLNMMGMALYEGTTVLTLSHLFGIELDMAAKTALLAGIIGNAMGATGTPSASLVTMQISLARGAMNAAQVMYSMANVVLPVDRIFDPLRTALNVEGDLVATMLLHKIEVASRYARLKMYKEGQSSKTPAGRLRHAFLTGQVLANKAGQEGAELIQKDIPQFITQDVPRLATEDLPRIVTKDIPDMAADFKQKTEYQILEIQRKMPYTHYLPI